LSGDQFDAYLDQLKERISPEELDQMTPKQLYEAYQSLQLPESTQ